MSSGERRKSSRITELEDRKKQEKIQRKRTGGKGTQGLNGRGDSQQSQRRRKSKTNQVHKASLSLDLDNPIHTDQLAMPSRIVMPEEEKAKLGLLLSTLQRRDSRNFFAEPVDENEVEDYYDVISDPMDFGTIANKLNDGSYSTLGEFKRDISLVFDNALEFNGSTTVYYRKARALKDDAERLFNTLESDPSNFEAECSRVGEGPTRRNKGVAGTVNSNAYCKTTGERRSECFKEDRRDTYRPWNSPNENSLLTSMVCESTQQLILQPDGGNINYAKRLMKFVEGMGPTAQRVARQKIASLIQLQNATVSEPQAINPVTLNGENYAKTWNNPETVQMPCVPAGGVYPFKRSFLRRENECSSSVGLMEPRGGYKGKEIQTISPNPPFQAFQNPIIDAAYTQTQMGNNSLVIPGNVSGETQFEARAYLSRNLKGWGPSNGGYSMLGGEGDKNRGTYVSGNLSGWGASSVGPTIGGETGYVHGGTAYTLENLNGGSAMFGTEPMMSLNEHGFQQSAMANFGTGASFNNSVINHNSADQTFDFLSGWNNNTNQYDFQAAPPSHHDTSSFYQDGSNQARGNIHYNPGYSSNVDDCGGQVLNFFKPVELDPPQVVGLQQPQPSSVNTWRDVRTLEQHPNWLKDMNYP